MVLRCKTRFRDLTEVLVDEIDWKQHINSAYFEFFQAARWPFRLTSSDKVLAVGEHSIILATDELEHFEDVYDMTGDRALLLAPKDGRRGLSTRNRIFLESRDSHPVFYRIVGTRLNIFPAPKTVAHTIRVWYHNPDPGALDDDLDVPDIPLRYHEAMVSGALAKAAADDENPSMVEVYRGEFMNVLNQAFQELGRFHDLMVRPEYLVARTPTPSG